MDGNLKNIPRFTAEASLYSATNHYHVHGMYQESEQRAYLADFVDQACLGACLEDCGAICVGSGKAGCISLCRAENEECRRSCIRPGDPPTGGGGGTGGGGNPCAPGTPCAGSCCPAGFPNCNTVGGTIVCCPPGFPVARTVPFFGIRCFPF